MVLQNPDKATGIEGSALSGLPSSHMPESEESLLAAWGPEVLLGRGLGFRV